MAFPDGFGRRCALVIQSGQVTDNEVNFPLLVTEDTLPSEIFDADGSYHALDGGGDIRFSSDEAGNTQLACEIESFVTDNDPANGKAAIWVKVPSLSSSTNTTIYIFYNKAGESQPAEDNAYGKENVWDTNFKMVQHMNQIPDGTADEIVDSTSNDNDGTTNNMDSADQVAGQIDGSLDFDGGNDYVDLGSDTGVLDFAGVDTATFSALVWLKADALVTSNYYTIVAKRANINNYQYHFRVYDNKLNFLITSGSFSGSTTLTPGLWYQVGVVFDDINESVSFYLNGVLDGSVTDNEWIEHITSNVTIGANEDGGSPFNGIIDEVRISNTARSAGWIATEYNNQNAPGTFLIEGTPQTPGIPEGAIPLLVGGCMGQTMGSNCNLMTG